MEWDWISTAVVLVGSIAFQRYWKKLDRIESKLDELLKRKDGEDEDV